MLPVFADFENIAKCGHNFKSEEFYNGFCAGRRIYIKLNGELSNGVPSVILTPKIVEHYFIGGQVGDELIIDYSLSKHQLSYVEEAYKKGTMQINVEWTFNLQMLLKDIGIFFQS